MSRKKGAIKSKIEKVASEFISFTAHQIKSPLVAIKGYADLVARGQYGKISDDARDVVLRIKAAAERSLDLANNLLDFKLIEEGKMKYDFQPIDLRKIVQDVCDELRPLADNNKLELTFARAKSAAIAEVDKKAMHQVIQNLVDNAIKYTPKGWIRVSVEVGPESILIKVVDSGRGMSKDILKTAFDKFTREEGLRQVIHGTGLGLFIAKTIVDDHDGKIWAESEGEGKGSTFFVELKLM